MARSIKDIPDTVAELEAEGGLRARLSPELRFLLDVIAAGFGAAPPSPEPGLDWARFLAAVELHRVVPLMAPALAPGTGVPDAARGALAEMGIRAARRMLALNAETARIVGAFRDAGIGILVLKGVALSALFHGDPYRRWSRDIDLLVRPDAEAAALAQLERLGYERMAGGEGMNAVPMHGPRMPFPLEVHTRLSDDDRMFPLALLAPFDGAVEVASGAGPVPTLRPEAALVYAVHHGTRHLWQHLYWLADVAAACRRDCVDWRAARDLARRLGVERQLDLGVLLTRELIGLSPPPESGWPEAGGPAVRRAAAALLPTLADGATLPDRSPHRFGVVRYLCWHLSLYRRTQARVAFLADQLKPGAADRRALPLPRFLGFLYPGVRMIRVLANARKARRGGR